MELVKLVHIGCVVLSGLFFFSRGAVMIRSPQFTTKVWVKRSAESIDTVLLLSGISLVWITGQMPWQEMWLATKLGLLLIYILLGMVAFHWGKTAIVRFSVWLMALLTFVMMISVAMTRSPWPL
jgi:uncharacterized membrane protein SirB2